MVGAKATVGGSSRGSAALREHAFKDVRPRKFFDIFDPLYWLAFALCLPVLTVPLNRYESKIVELNIRKHRQVLWMTAALGALAWYGIGKADKKDLNELVVALLAPAFVTGGAWFAVTFGGVQEKLLDAAIGLTKWMFAAFSVSLVTMFIALAQILPWPLTIVIGAIIALVLLSAVTYDNVDSLKIGLDDALRRHSLTMLAKLGSEGIPTIDSEEQLQEFIARSSKLSEQTRTAMSDDETTS